MAEENRLELKVGALGKKIDLISYTDGSVSMKGPSDEYSLHPDDQEKIVEFLNQAVAREKQDTTRDPTQFFRGNIEIIDQGNGSLYVHTHGGPGILSLDEVDDLRDFLGPSRRSKWGDNLANEFFRPYVERALNQAFTDLREEIGLPKKNHKAKEA